MSAFKIGHRERWCRRSGWPTASKLGIGVLKPLGGMRYDLVFDHVVS